MTARLDIAPDHLHCVQDILGRYIPKDAEIWVFGSRATGNAKPFSDLDIAIARTNKQYLDSAVILGLQEAFEQSLLPWKVDIVDFNKATPTFQNIINQHKQKLELGIQKNTGSQGEK